MARRQKLVVLVTAEPATRGIGDQLRAALAARYVVVEIDCSIPREEFDRQCYAARHAAVLVVAVTERAFEIEAWRTTVVTALWSMDSWADVRIHPLRVGISPERSLALARTHDLRHFLGGILLEHSSERLAELVQDVLCEDELPQRNPILRRVSLIGVLILVASTLGMLIDVLVRPTLAAGAVLWLASLWWVGSLDAWTRAFSLYLTFLVGYFLVSVPTTPPYLALQVRSAVAQRRSYVMRWGLPFALVIALLGRRSLEYAHVALLFLGLVAALLGAWLLLKGLAGFRRVHGMARSTALFERWASLVRGSSADTSRLSVSDVWDRFIFGGAMGLRARTLSRRRPRIFISYTWHSERDLTTARNWARWLRARQHEVFIDHEDAADRSNIPRGAAWRSLVVEAILNATHFIHFGSVESATSTTCPLEVSCALTLAAVSVSPTLSVCLLDSEAELRVQYERLDMERQDSSPESGEWLRWLMTRAVRLDARSLFDEANVQKWIDEASPGNLLSDTKRLLSG